MSPKNLSLTIPAASCHFSLLSNPVPSAGPHDILIKNASISLAPLDYKIRSQPGYFPLSYPLVAGFAFAGTVTAIGSAVTAFKPGDRVVACKPFSDLSIGNEYGAFQQFALARDTAAAKLADNTSLEAASAVVGNLISVVGAFHLCMGMRRPSIPPKPVKAAPEATSESRAKKEKILIYGGSSSFGMLASEYATHAGYAVVTTSSPSNMDEVRRFCSQSSRIVNHRLPQPDVIAALVTEGPYDYVFDAIGSPASTAIVAQVVHELGAGEFWSTKVVKKGEVVSNLPLGVTMKGESYPGLVERDEETRRWFFGEYLPKGLELGMITQPKIEKVDGGLRGVEAALERIGRGEVSGTKVIVDLSETREG